MQAKTLVSLLAVAVSSSACHGASVPGGNNAPVYPKPTTTSTTSPTQPRKPAAASPSLVHSSLPGGGQAYVGAPQAGRPWVVPGSPEWVAAQWTVAYKSTFYSDPSPGYWMVRIKPYTTPSFYRSLLPLSPAARNPYAVAPADKAFWATVQQQRQSTRIQIVEATRVDQAGFTPTSEIVSVLYGHFYESVDSHPSYATNPVDRYLCMVKTGGRWLVSNETLATNPIRC